MAKNGKLRSNLETVLGSAPPNHQAHHLVSDNVVKKSDLYAEALHRNKDGEIFYDIDRPSNGKFLAETADDYKNKYGDWVSDSYKFPTHNGSHGFYDGLITDEVNEFSAALKTQYGSLNDVPDNVLTDVLSELEEAALELLINWKPSRLN